MAAFEEVGICPELVDAASKLGWRYGLFGDKFEGLIPFFNVK
jgi:hypothetical protein